MYIDILILAILIGSILGLSVAILFIVNVYSRMTKKVEETEKEKILLHTNITKKAEDLLQEAHTTNVRIIADANKQATQIVAEAKQAKSQSEEALSQKLDQLLKVQEQTFEKLSSDFLKTYQDSLTKLQTQELQEVQKVSGAIEQTAEKQITEFQNTLAKETVDIEKHVKEEAEKKLADTDAQIQSYRESQFEAIRQEMYPLLQKIMTDALGKSLSLEDHEQLIKQALEDAQNKMFQNTSKVNTDQQPMAPTHQVHA